MRFIKIKIESRHISYKTACVPRSEESDQPVYPYWSVLAGHYVCSQGSKASLGGQRGLWSACPDAQADVFV